VAEKLNYLSKTDAVAEFLRNEIISGTLRRGQPLRQEEIATRLGVSSTPVREAFRVLQAEGFLVQRPHRGTSVAVIDPVRMREAAEVRGALEQLAVVRALRIRDRSVLAVLEANLAASSKMLSKPDVHGFRIVAADFHRLLVAAGGSPVLNEVSAVLRASTNAYVPLDVSGMTVVQRSHAAIVSALRRQDAKRLEREISAHAAWSARRLPEQTAVAANVRRRSESRVATGAR
jgi:DNA-binding GntR family transcriptional regulator